MITWNEGETAAFICVSLTTMPVIERVINIAVEQKEYSVLRRIRKTDNSSFIEIECADKRAGPSAIGATTKINMKRKGNKEWQAKSEQVLLMSTLS